MAEKNYHGHINDFGVVPDDWWRFAAILEENELRYVDDVMKNKWRAVAEYEGFMVPIILMIAEDHTNILAARIMDDSPDVAFVMVINLRKNSVSVRSTDDAYDCSKFAQSMSSLGGGHVRAAGFPLLPDGFNLYEKIKASCDVIW
jgi:hypothetical protein